MFAIALFSSTTLASVTFAAGCALLAMILLRRSYRYFGKRSRGGSGPAIAAQKRPTSEWDGVKRDAEARFNRQQVELQELARELNGQIDSKMILLQKLIVQADQQAARLEELLERSEQDV